MRILKFHFTFLVLSLVSRVSSGVQSALLTLILRSLSWMRAFKGSTAFFAQSAVWATRRIVSVFQRKLMPIHTMRPASVLSERIVAAQRVNSRRHGLKVDWIDAGRASAKMVGLKIANKYFHEHLIAHAMGADSPARSAHVKLAVLLVHASSPQPARNAIEQHVRVYLDLAEKAGKKVAVYGNAVSIGLHGLFSLKVGQIVFGLRGNLTPA